MRILLVVRPCQGGMQSHVNTLVTGLTKLGHRVYVVGSQRELEEKGASVFPIPSATNPVRFLKSAHMLGSLIEELTPDIVHFHGALAALLGLAVSKSRRSAWIYTVHNFLASGATGFLRRDDLLAKKMNAVIAVSKSLALALVDQGVPYKKITVVHNGIDLELFRPRPFKLPQMRPMFLSMGRLAPEKGYVCLLKAVAQVKTSGWPQIRLVIAGDGPQRTQLENLVGRLGIGGEVLFVGYVQEPNELLQDAFALITPSVREGLGLVNIEAMATGLPVISTWTGGIPEVVVHGETGLLVPPGKPSALTEAMILLLENPKTAERLGLAATKRAHSHFSAAAMISATLQVYREALEA